MTDMSAAPQGQDMQQQQQPDGDDGQDTICVEIEVNKKTGEVKVGLEPADGTEAGDDDSYMQPVQSLDAAFAQAKQLLSGGGQPTSPADQAAFEQGYKNVSQGTGGSGY
jgi:hypothetical protein